MLEKYTTFMEIMKKIFNTDKDYVIIKHASAIFVLVGLYLYIELSLIEKTDMKTIDKLIIKTNMCLKEGSEQ